MEIILDERLKERVLCSADLKDWMSILEETYLDLDLKFEGGESSYEAMRRGIDLLEELYDRPESNMIVVTHGALLSLIIKHYEPSFGFEDWKRLTNPDIYRLEIGHGKVVIDRISSTFQEGL